MSCITSEEAKLRVCWVSIESGLPTYCDGEECMAWEKEGEASRKGHKDDISPRGYCSLLVARLNEGLV